ncbi:MAG: ECF-type sigma factor [Thermoanaerobaculia bacterium]|nr:ECF-type sigma factor [Thermoanaerobaculia bacterium]
MRSLALAHLRSLEVGRGGTLQPTVLVNEAYLRLSDRLPAPFANRREFFAFASRVLRHILVDYVRQRSRQKRGGAMQRVTLEAARGAAAPKGVATIDLLSLHQALDRLETSHPDHARVVELRFFGGLTHKEIADVSGSSLSTVERQWSVGKRRLALLMSA